MSKEDKIEKLKKAEEIFERVEEEELTEDPKTTLKRLLVAEDTISQLNLQIQMMNEQMRHERENYLEMISQVNARYGQVATENMLLVNQNQ